MTSKSNEYEYSSLECAGGSEGNQIVHPGCHRDAKWRSRVFHGGLYVAVVGSLLLNVIQFVNWPLGRTGRVLGDRSVTAYGMRPIISFETR
jgi:hypothetical protein